MRKVHLAAIAAIVVAASLGGASSASAQTAATCGYGQGGPFASNLCWFDMAAYNDATARSGAGQEMEITLPGGYVASFTLTSRQVGTAFHQAVESRTTPIENRFAFGSTGANGGYRGVPGRPALYSGGGSGRVALTLNGIEVVDSSGQPVTGYRFVIADAENNITGENFTWTSNKPLDLVGVLNDGATAGCNVPPNLAGLGTQTVTCTGRGNDSGSAIPRYDGVVVGADTPSTIGLSMSTFARSGVAFAIQTSKIELNKSVVGREQATDSFDISVTSPEGTEIGSDSTGTEDSATTGELTVLPRTNGATYTLSEEVTPGSGTDPEAYDRDWSCTNNGVADPALPGGSGTSVEVSPAAGDHIECTVVNSAPAPAFRTCTPEQERATQRWWFYGANAGIDFQTSGTTATKLVTPGNINSVEGTTVITDTEGRLRFWSNGQTVYNANHEPMPNGAGLLGNPSATQTVAAFPAIGDPNKYFVVTTNSNVTLGTLTYSVVDMSLDGGLGAVTATKNVQLGPTGSASEALTAVPNEDGTGFWVLTYTPNSPNVRAYEFDASGPIGDPNGVVSVMPTNNLLGFGTLNFSADLSRLVAMTGTRLATPERSKIRLLGFDAETGKVWQKAEWEPAAAGLNGYSAEFSPSGDYVYATKIFSGGRLYRYDVANNTTGAEIKASEVDIGSIGTNGGQVKRAPDGRMYIANANHNAISVVANPDNANPANVGFSSLGFTLLPGSTSRYGLPQLVTGCPIPPESDLELTKSAEPTTAEVGEEVTFTLDVSNEGPDDSPAVTVTDELPAGLEYVSSVPACDVNDLPTITCQLGAMQSGGTSSVEIVARVRDTASDSTIENTAVVSGPNVDPEPEDNDGSASVDVDPASDLELAKTADQAAIDPEDNVTFTLQVTNNGPDDESAATVTDTLPDGLTYVSSTGTCNTIALPQVTCDLGAIPSGESRSVTITAQADADAGGTFPLNTAIVNGENTDTNPDNDDAEAEVRIRPYADLALEKSASPTVADPDGTVVYALAVTNHGGNDSPAATVTDTLPGGVTYDSADADCDTTLLPEISCDVGPVANGATETIHVTVTVNSDAGNTTQTNDASVTGPLSDPEPDNNSSEADIFVTPVSDLSVTKTAPETARAGRQLTYTLAYANAGPTASPAPTTITDTLPTGVTYVSGDGDCTAVMQQVTCEVGPLGANADGSVLITVAIAVGTRGEIENTATIDGPNTDPDESDNSAEASTEIGPPLTDLAIVKEGTALADPGDPVTYTLTVTNNGPDDSPSAEITDTLPAGLNFASANPPCDESALPEVTCTIGELEAGDSETFEINATVDQDAGGTVQTNTATVNGPGEDTDDSNDTDTAETQVPPLSDLGLTKTAPGGPFEPGDQIPYRLTVSNDGPTESPNTVVSDTLPAGLSYVSDDSDCDATAAPEITCDLGTLADGETRTVVITTRLDRVAGSSISNEARVSGGNVDPDPGNETSTVTSQTRQAPAPPVNEARCFFGNKVTILGTDRPERIVGTPGRDVINGRRGNDVIIGLAGNDLICGGAGEDKILGGRGNDRVKGSTGDDLIHGNLGNDWLRGAPGNDNISGRQGNDRLMGNNGDDRLRGRAGNDDLLGGPGIDWGSGGPGRNKGFSLETALGVNPCVNC